jgi:hypothetical protein
MARGAEAGGAEESVINFVCGAGLTSRDEPVFEDDGELGFFAAAHSRGCIFLSLAA